jgi:hypothetical protein
MAISRNGQLSLPAIRGTTAYDISLLTISIAGQPRLENIRVATLPTGSIQTLLRYVSPGDPALISLGDTYAVIDDSKLTIDTPEMVSGQVQLQDLSDQRLQAEQSTEEVFQGLCIRPIFPLRGLVKWDMKDPRAAGFSYKLEGPSTLAWASAPENVVDGIYNKNWGCNRALKIPDHCTVTWSASSYSYCCNLAGILIGKGLPRWVTPGIGSGEGSTWPGCPLR